MRLFTMQNTMNRSSNEEKMRLLESTFFNVKKITMTELNEKTNRYEDNTYLFNTETGKKLSKVSDRYTIVHNRDLVMPIVSHFGIENLSSVVSNGRSFIYKINTGRNFDIGNIGDVVNEQIVIVNSYNKSKSFNFLMGALRLVCLNGLTLFNTHFSYKKRHVGIIPISDLIGNVFTKYQSNDFSLWKDLQAVKISQANQIELSRQFNAFNIEDDKHSNNKILNEKIRLASDYKLLESGSLDIQENAWGLFNAINWSINKVVKNPDKNLLANKNLEKYLLNLS